MQLKEKSGLQNFVPLLDLFCFFVLNSSFFNCFILCLLLYPLLYLLLYLFLYLLLCPFLFLILDPFLFYCLVLCPILFLVLDPPLFCCLVVCPLRLDLQLFPYFVMFLFLIAKFQLFYHRFLVYSIYFYLLDFHLLAYSNGLCQMSFGLAYQLILKSFFVCFQLLACIL